MENEIKVLAASPQNQKRINYSALKEILLQNVSRTRTKTFTQYTKDLIKQYSRNPYSNINEIRNVSAFLARSSMIYKKIISYIAQMPLFHYNIIYKSDFTQGINPDDMIQEYMEVSKHLNEFHMLKEFSTVIATALRDGIYYGFVYDNDGDGFFIHSLDPQYCKISGITEDGEYIFSFNASYFDSGNNTEYLYGINEDGEGTWDSVFIEGYENYKSLGRDYMWFELPPEKSICIPADEDAEMPLPYFLPVFTSLLDLLDLEQIVASKTELENYVLLLSKIPLLSNTQEVDDFAISSEMVQMIQDMINEVVPDLVGVAYSPCDIEVVNFNNPNSTEDTDKISQSMNNLFSNLGFSELVVSSGSSTNGIGLKHSIQNDESLALKFLDKLESWMNAYIKANYSENFVFKFHRFTYFSQDDYINRLTSTVTMGIPNAMDLATALGRTPYEVMCSTYMENALGIKNGLWKPLQTSYTQSSDTGGRPLSDEEDLTEEGSNTRDGEKNQTTKAGQ